MELRAVISEKAGKHGAKTAIVFGERRVSYSELDETSNRIANGLIESGLKAGDRVALLFSNCPDFMLCYLGIVKAGGIAVPLNTMLGPDDLDFYFNDCRPKVLIAESQFLAPLTTALPSFDSLQRVIEFNKDLPTSNSSECPIVEVGQDDANTILYTSGTTGRPKGVLRTHQRQIAGLTLMANAFGQTGDDVTLNTFPPFHMGGLEVTPLTTLRLGGTVILGSGAVLTETLELIQKEKVTIFGGTPLLFNGMLNMPDEAVGNYDLSSVRVCWSGGAPLPGEILKGVKQKFGIDIVELWVSTETAAFVSIQPLDGSGKPGSAGKIVTGWKVKMVGKKGEELPAGQEGEIAVKSASVTRGYYNSPHATAETIKDDWLYTGDIGKMDEDGNLFILGRKKEVITVGGKDVYPADVEEVLYTHPRVAEAAVVGIPDQSLGEAVKAVVVLKEGEVAITEEMLDICRQHLAEHEVPKEIEFRDALPRTPVGKIRKEELK